MYAVWIVTYFTEKPPPGTWNKRMHVFAFMVILLSRGRDKGFKGPILTTLTRKKFIEDESVSHEPCDSMYPNIY